MILTQTQSSLSRERSAPEYRESLSACGRAAGRMRGLIESLLLLARSDSPEPREEFEPCDLGRVATEVSETLKPLADGCCVGLELQVSPAPCSGNAGQLAQAVANLADNAIRYSRPGGAVRVSVRHDENGAVLTVSDTGDGIATPTSSFDHTRRRKRMEIALASRGGELIQDDGMEERYCQFGKRFLDGFSWIAPVTNNRLGDALNIEFVHEQLFTIEGEKVLHDVGYGEKGKRFSEADYGKPIKSLSDLAKNGYWLVGRTYHPEAAEEALAEIDDGHYYSFFSNQCQDWADRMCRKMEQIEKARRLAPLGKPEEEAREKSFWEEKPPTAPASALLGLLAIGLGVGSMLAPAVAAHRSVWILAAFLVVSGISEIIYAFHGRVWSQIIGTIFFAFLNIAAGGALFLDTQFAANWAGGLFGLAFGFNGLAHIVVAVRSRPFMQWLGTLLTGIAMLAGAILLLTHTIGERDVLFGVMIGVNLILGGLSTLWLRWSVRGKPAQATPGKLVTN